MPYMTTGFTAATAIMLAALAAAPAALQAQEQTLSADELSAIRQQAEAGDAAAQFNMSIFHRSGRGVPRGYG